MNGVRGGGALSTSEVKISQGRDMGTWLDPSNGDQGPGGPFKALLCLQPLLP